MDDVEILDLGEVAPQYPPISTVHLQSGEHISVELLQNWVDRYAQWGRVNKEGIVNSLHAKLNKGNLKPFIHEETQRGKSIREEAADYLLRDTEAIEATE